MAKIPFDPTTARVFLEGRGISTSKVTTEAYLKRLYQATQKAERENRPVSRAVARGHKEEIKPPKPPLPEVEVKTRPTVRKGDLPQELQGIPRVTKLPNGNKVYSVRSEGAALKAIQEAARLDKRVVITVYSANTGESHTIYTSQRMWFEGITAQYLLDQIEANGWGLDDQLEHDYGEGSCGPLPELGDIGLYTIAFVDTPAKAA